MVEYLWNTLINSLQTFSTNATPESRDQLIGDNAKYIGRFLIYIINFHESFHNSIRGEFW